MSGPSTQPDEIHVEAAWANDPLDASYTWVDISARCLAIQTSRGRQHETDRVEPSRATLRFDNRDDAFNPWNTSSPFNSGGNRVDAMRPLRVWCKQGGTTHPIWQGYLTNLQQVWQDGPNSEVIIEGQDAFRPLNLVSVPGPYPNEITADTPLAYYRFQEAASATTAADSGGLGHSGTYNPATVIPGTGFSPLSDSSARCVALEGGWVDATTAVAVTGPFSVEFWVGSAPIWLSVRPAGEIICAQGAGSGGWEVDLMPGGFIKASVNGGASVTGTHDVADGGWHHVVVEADGTNLSIYIDGTLDQQVASGASFTAGDVTIGKAVGLTAPAAVLVAEWAIYNFSLSAARITDHYAARSSRSGETPGNRIAWALTLAGWPTGLEALDPGTVSLGPLQSSTSVLSHILDVAAAEAGYTFMTADGKVAFYDHGHSLGAATIIFADAAPGGITVPYLLPQVQLARDDLDINNDVQVIAADNTVAYAVDLPSQHSYFRRVLQQNTVGASEAQAQVTANSLLSFDKTPTDRVRSVTVNGLSDPATVFPVILGQELWNVATFTRTKFPGGGSAFTQDSVIEGIEHQWTPDAGWSTTFRLSPRLSEGPMASGATPAAPVTAVAPSVGIGGSVGATTSSLLPSTQQSGTTYTFALTDAGTVVEFTSGSAVTATIPPNSSVAFPVGTILEVFQDGAGQVTIAAGTGVTIRSDGSKVKTAAQFASIGLRQRAANEWVLTGDLA